ncbi:solute carrier organic anion transporter family member [Plakobranchus ocellatus]|uniref:Solute carrier organic anion transporter family member n=1 Tax=Plakobranchus ocellatus TaxID=259542 RepID=A0AAV4D6R0_9GAST|nr:solute carrier organic anion transporter family member [Plakobranchus ocellatus]
MDGWMERMDGWMNGWNGWMDGWMERTDGWMDGRIDRQIVSSAPYSHQEENKEIQKRKDSGLKVPYRFGRKTRQETKEDHHI